MRTAHADKSRGRMFGKFVHCSTFAKAANRSYINVLHANSLWCTDSWRIAFGCSPNIRRTAESGLTCHGSTSTLNQYCQIKIPKTFTFSKKKNPHTSNMGIKCKVFSSRTPKWSLFSPLVIFYFIFTRKTIIK